MNPINKLLITPAEGFSPHIGVLVSTLERCREKTIALVQDLTIRQLDYLYDSEANSIGALLLHMAAIEAAYQENTFYGRNIWKWFHVYEDEISHRGEISWLKSRIPLN